MKPVPRWSDVTELPGKTENTERRLEDQTLVARSHRRRLAERLGAAGACTLCLPLGRLDGKIDRYVRRDRCRATARSRGSGCRRRRHAVGRLPTCVRRRKEANQPTTRCESPSAQRSHRNIICSNQALVEKLERADSPPAFTRSPTYLSRVRSRLLADCDCPRTGACPRAPLPSRARAVRSVQSSSVIAPSPTSACSTVSARSSITSSGSQFENRGSGLD